MDEGDLLEVARMIRPHLSELVGDEAQQVDLQLEELLDRATAGESVKVPMLQLLRQRDATREWASKLLRVPPQYRSYESLPGRTQIKTVPRYVCPYGDADWYRFSVADEVPLCPRHQVPLVRAA